MQMLTPFFPAPPSQLQGIRSYGVVSPERPFTVGSATIRAARLSHPGVTYGYRIEADGVVFVYISDDEPAVADPEVRADIVELARDADLLLHDCQFTQQEYLPCRYWGHSTPQQAVGIARDAGVRRLLLFHHAPAHTDEQVEALAEEARRLAGGIEIIVGREGETQALAGTRAIVRET